MALINRALGAPIFSSIGKRGERPDVYGSRIAGPVTLHFVNGRPTEFVNVIELRTNRNDEQYLAERLVNLQYAWDRTEPIEQLDGTPDAPKTLQMLAAERMANLEAFRSTQGQEVSIEELA